MYNNKKILAFIPARWGSKRVPHKNSLEIKGKKLFMYSVEYAKTSQFVDDVIVSSDSEDILKIAHKAGCLKNDPRPKNLSADTARIVDAILYEVSKLNQHYDAVVLLQPTYPIRPAGMIDEAIKQYFTKETSLISVTKAKEQPEFTRYIKKGRLHKILSASSDIRSQNFQQYYKIIGSIYINNLSKLNKKTVLNENEIPYLIDEYYSLDIDTYADLTEFQKRMGAK